MSSLPTFGERGPLDFWSGFGLACRPAVQSKAGSVARTVTQVTSDERPQRPTIPRAAFPVQSIHQAQEASSRRNAIQKCSLDSACRPKLSTRDNRSAQVTAVELLQPTGVMLVDNRSCHGKQSRESPLQSSSDSRHQHHNSPFFRCIWSCESAPQVRTTPQIS